MNDYRRPAEYQIRHHYKCQSCRRESEFHSDQSPPTKCLCGGSMEFSGESYPADSREWDEERDNVNDEFRNSRRGRY